MRKWLIVLAVAAVGILSGVLLVHAYVGFYTRYIADDFYTAGILADRGIIGSQIYWYDRWTGRFSFTLTVNIAELFGPRVVSYLPGLALATWLLVLTWTVYQIAAILRWGYPKAAAVIVALLLIFVSTDGLPGLYQDLYWQTGIMTYLAPLISLIFLIGVLAWYGRHRPTTSLASSRKRSMLWIAFVFGLAFFTGGFSDTSVILLAAFFLLILLGYVGAGWLQQDRLLLASLFAGLLGSIVAMMILIAAPGNARRLSFYPPQPGLERLAPMSVAGAWEFTTRWFATQAPVVLLAVAAMILVCWELYPKSETTKRHGALAGWKAVPWLLLAPLVAFVLVVGCFAPAFWGMSKPPPWRALLVPQYVLACLVLSWAWVAAHSLRQAVGIRITRSPLLTLVLAAIVGITLVVGPVQSIRRNLAILPAARNYADQWDRRDQLLREARSQGATDVEVPVLVSISGLEELVADTGNWVNQVTADYYGLKTLRTP